MTNPVIENVRRSLGRTAQAPLGLRPAIYESRQPESVAGHVDRRRRDPSVEEGRLHRDPRRHPSLVQRGAAVGQLLLRQSREAVKTLVGLGLRRQIHRRATMRLHFTAR